MLDDRVYHARTFSTWIPAGFHPEVHLWAPWPSGPGNVAASGAVGGTTSGGGSIGRGGRTRRSVLMVTAYILIQTEVGKAAQVAKEISEIKGVQQAEDVTGPYDVIVRAEARNVDDLGKLVVTGEAIAALDRTGKLTRKFQAKRRPLRVGSRLVSPFDTEHLQRLLRPSGDIPSSTLEATSASGRPTPGTLLSIQAIFDRLKVLEGMRLEDPGHDQDRVRGELLQREVAKALGLGPYVNRGQWPDILSQALEIKLQTASTIDLGLVLPSSSAPAREVGEDMRHCDIRYAVVYGHSVGATGIVLTEVVVVTGQDFFTEFQQFAGLVENAKLQIPLPRTFFRQSE